MGSDAFLLTITPDWHRFLDEADPASGWRFSDDFANRFWEYVEESPGAPGSYAKCGYLVFEAVRLMLFDDRPALVSRILERAIQLALTMDLPGMIRPDYRHLPEAARAELTAPLRLRTHVMRAIAETLQRGRPPTSSLLAEGAEFVAAAYRGRRGKLPPGSGMEGVMLATVCALLSHRLDLARELLAIRSAHPEQARHFAWLKRAVASDALGPEPAAPRAPGLVVAGRTEFYQLFNAYRLPHERDRQRALVDAPMLVRDPLVCTYLLAWVHWTLYTAPPRERVDLREMRRVLTG